MRTTDLRRFAGFLFATALVLTVRIAGFAPAPPPGGGHPPELLPRQLSLPLADFNGDGQPDVAFVVRTEAGDEAIRIAVAGCGKVDLPLTRPLAGLIVNDYDHDGDPDIVGLGFGGRLYVWENEGGCQLVAREPFGPRSPTEHGPSLGPAMSAGDPLSSVETLRPTPPVRRLLRIRVNDQPHALRLSGHSFRQPQSISTDAEFSRPPPSNLPAIS